VTPIIVISIDDEEYCVAVLRQYGVDVRVEERTRLPGKLEVEKRTKAKREFFRKALQSLKETWKSTHSPVVVIGPGFIKNDFMKFTKAEASEIANAVIDVKGVNSSGLAGIKEALRSGVLDKALRHVRIVEETKVMEEVLERLGKGRLDVTYGLADVEKASLFGAVEKLLLADVTLRETTDEKRTALEKLMREVEERGGQIILVSTEHEAGAKLLSLGGIAALLRFPVG
jgi:protein pelota